MLEASKQLVMPIREANKQRKAARRALEWDWKTWLVFVSAPECQDTVLEV